MLFFALMLAVPLYSLPATFWLRRGRRAGIGPYSLKEAAGELTGIGLEGIELVEAAHIGEQDARGPIFIGAISFRSWAINSLAAAKRLVGDL